MIEALCRYKMELPRLEKQAIKELKKLEKDHSRSMDRESDCYNFKYLPIFKLKDEYIQYQNFETFVKYIDFDKMYDDFTVFVFCDGIFKGSMHLSNYDKSYFSVKDTNIYNKQSFESHFNLAKQIMEFNPDMAFFPDSFGFICFIKEGKLYIGRHEKQFQPLDSIVPIDEFVKNSTRFIKELESDRCLGVKHYLQLKKCPNS